MIKEEKLEEREIASASAAIKKRRPVKDSYTAARDISALAVFCEKSSVRFAAAAAVCFLLTGARLGGIHSPMTVPFCAVSGMLANAGGFVGTVISCIIFGSFSENAAELAAELFMLAVKFIVSRRFSVKGSVILASLAYFVFGILSALYFGFSGAAFAAVIFRTAMCGSAAYIYGRACAVPFGDGKRTDPVPSFVCGMILASALCGINFLCFDLGRIFICAVSAVFAKRYGCGGGAAAGTAGAAAMILADSAFSRSAVFVSCAALVTGLTAHRGRLSTALCFIFSSLITAIIVGMPSGVTEYMADSAMAGIIYFIIPERLYRPYMDKMDRYDRGESRHNCARLAFSSDVMSEISGDISAARRIYESKEREYDVAAAVRLRVCSKCRSNECGDTVSFFSKEENSPLESAAKLVSRKGGIGESDLPPRLGRCIRKAEIVKALNHEHIAEELRRVNEKMSCGLCAASLEQLKVQRLVYENMGSSELRRSGRLSVIAEDALRCFEINVRSAAVYFDRCGRAFVETFITENGNIPFSEITDRLSAITGTALDMPMIERSDNDKNILRCRWCRVPELIADACIRSIAGSDEKSGDTAEFFTDGFGKYYLIIADGMGSGIRAAEESCMAVSVIKRFIRAGTGTDAAVCYANLLLAGVSNDEIFTTADIMELDVYTGKCVFYKHGAAESYIKRGDEVIVAENSSLPLGIITETSVMPLSFRLNAGDCAAMISDGIRADGRYIRETITNESITAEMCAERIVSAEKKDIMGRDDRTAAVVKLYRY